VRKGQGRGGEVGENSGRKAGGCAGGRTRGGQMESWRKDGERRRSERRRTSQRMMPKASLWGGVMAKNCAD